MIRALAEALLAFLVPFVVFGLVLAATGRNPLKRDAWTERSLLLVIAGLACVILGFVVTGFLAERATGAYVPAHMENGHLVPGRFQ
jgi:multisubunit Na+/H+ antiporter MnhB subunit